ncbi:hypothetical protein IV454_16450 [Massilia antarctica]|uniref:ATP-binding protein n=1 Tax=Massilia antarctica TaxID=2765360 RepID=A0AA49ABG9_9BURK|nr:hypothetical protein [Massilia antarctica]QPI52937.1 hypothetical protein IV454_16450 [Massilia antarctica]
MKEVHAPRTFELVRDSDRALVFHFLDEIGFALKDGQNVKIKFDRTVELHPCGTLVFMARLDCWMLKYPGRLFCNYPKDEVVEQLFQHVGLLARFGLEPRREISNERVAFWHFHSGSKADPSAFLDMTLAAVKEIDHPNAMLFADCLNEAICNTVGHAYKQSKEVDVPLGFRKWWIFSQFRDERFFVAIYDVGDGIPRTLRRKPEWIEFLRARQYNDAKIIRSAIESNRTSTRQPERGKGLPEMLEFSKSLKAGGLSILSAKGGFEYAADTSTMRNRKFSLPLGGTLVQWAIPFRKEHGHGNDELLNS